MIKFGIVLLLICTIAVLCYLVFISLRLLKKSEAERKAELQDQKKEVQLHPKLRDQNNAKK